MADVATYDNKELEEDYCNPRKKERSAFLSPKEARWHTLKTKNELKYKKVEGN